MAQLGLSNISNTIKPVLTNLLTNSQWMAMSGSTLENVGSNLVTSWVNLAGSYETFTSSGANISSAISTGGTDTACSNITFTNGKLYKVIATLTLNSGLAPTIGSGAANAGTANGGLASRLLIAGVNTIVFEANSDTACIWLQNLGATNFSCTFTLYEVTPGYVAADSLAPDGWSKDSVTDIFRQHNDGTLTKNGSFYSLKIIETAAAAGQSIQWPNTGTYALSEHIKKFAGRTMSFGVWAKTSVAASVVIEIYDGVSLCTSTHTGGGGWEWLECTGTVRSAATQFRVLLYVRQIDTAYFSQPMLVFGSSISEGLFQPIPNEVIWLQTYVVTTTYNGDSGTPSVNSNINLEAETKGQIGKGIKAIDIWIRALNTTPAKGMNILPSTGKQILRVTSQVTGIVNDATGWINCDSNGDIRVEFEDANFNFSLIRINAIQT